MNYAEQSTMRQKGLHLTSCLQISAAPAAARRRKPLRPYTASSGSVRRKAWKKATPSIRKNTKLLSGKGKLEFCDVWKNYVIARRAKPDVAISRHKRTIVCIQRYKQIQNSTSNKQRKKNNCLPGDCHGPAALAMTR